MKFLSDILARAGLVVDGTVTLNSVANATTDTDRFIVVDSGVVKYRTGTQLLSDIGAQAALTNPVTGTGAAGQVAYWNGTTSQSGSNNLFWDITNSRLGIGTTTPQVALDIAGSLRVSGAGGTGFFNGSNIILETPIAWANIGGSAFQIRNTTSLGLVFGLSTSQLMTLTTGGSFGIGTTSPNEKLHVAGNIHAYAAGGIDAGLFASTAGGSTTIAIRSNGATLFNGGNVGIGVTSPTKKLHIGISNAAHTNEGIILESSGGWGGAAIYHDYVNAGDIYTNLKISNTYSDSRIDFVQENYNAAGSPGSIRFYTQPNGNGGVAIERKRIKSTGQIQYQAYTSSSSFTGTAAGLLAFDSSGNLITLANNTYLTGNQTITLSGDATGSGATAITVTLANSGVAAATYGSASAVPVITVDAKGRVTNVTTASISGSLTFTGDVTGSGTTGTTTTLTLANSGVTAGTYTKVTVDAKGRVTTGASLLAADIPALNYLPIGGGTLTGNVIVWPGSNASYGAGFKFRNDTYAHYSIGVKGSSFVLSNTGSDGTVVWPVSITDLITVSTSGNTVIAGTVTASSIIKSGGTSSQFLKADGSVDSTTYQSTSQKGQANGYASLDGAGKVPIAQLPSSIMEYKGTWNASTNSPSLADGTGDTGDVYRVSTAGTRNLGSGSITFDVGDYVIYNGTIWEKSDTTDAVASVNGFTGVITLTTTNIGEGTNLYYTDARARAAITLTTTGTSGAATYSGGVLNIPQYQPAGSYLTAESDTLATVTGRGATTSTGVTFNGSVNTGGANGIELGWTGSTINDQRIGRIRPISTPSQNPYAGGLAFDYYKYSGTQYQFYEGMRLSGAGYLGLGTSSPSHKLHIVPDSSSDSIDALCIESNWGSISNHMVRFDGNVSGTGDGNVLLVRGGGTRTDTEIFEVQNGSGTQLFVRGDGKVGIGTTSVTAKLHVVANSNQDGFFVSAADSSPFTAKIATFRYAANGNDICIEAQGGKAAIQARAGASTMDLLLNAAGGYVGIGTTAPATPLHVLGGPTGTGSWNKTATLAATYPGLIFNSNGTKWGGIAYDYSAGMRFWVNASNDDIFATTNVLSILNNGNVGINSSAPTFKLEVGGTTYLNGNVSINTNYNGFALNVSGTTYVIGGHVWVQNGYGYTNSGSTSTGMYPDSSHNIDFRSNNGTAIYVNSSKYVGINTTSPDRLFTIAPASGDAYINLKRPVAASTQATLEFNTAGTNDWLIRTDDASANLKFYSYGTSGYALILARSTGAATFSSSVTASSLIKSGGTSAQFLMADGSVSTNPGWITSYTETDTLATVTGRGASTSTAVTFNNVLRAVAPANTFEFALKLTKGNYADTGGHTTLIGFGCENSGWSRSAIGHTRTTSYDAGYLGFYVSNNTSNGNELVAADLKMMINRDGNIGIGTTNPGQKLVVNGGAWINQTSDYFGSGTTVQISAGGTGSVGVWSNILYLYPYSTNTNTRLVYGYNGNYSWELTNTSGNSRFDILSSTTTVMSLLQAGSVGIGTTSPGTAKLYVRGQGTGGFNTIFEDNTSPYCWLQIKASGGGSNSSWQLGSYNNGFNFYNDNNGAYRVFFGDNGNVGIGTTAPSHKLEIKGASDSGLKITDSSGNTRILLTPSGVQHGEFALYNNSGGATTYLGGGGGNNYLMAQGGNLGIGLSNPSTGDRVEIAGTLRVHTGNNWDAIQIYTDGANGYIQGLGDETGLRIRSQYGNIMLADDRANVAIGTTSPDGKLYVYQSATWSSGNMIGVNTTNAVTFSSAASLGTVAISAVGAGLALTYSGNATIGNSGRTGAIDAIITVGNGSAGTITLTQASTIRAMAGISSATYYNPSAATTITHLAGIRVLPDINTGAGAVTVTNKYGILIGDASGGTGSITYTNRWGIYQEGGSDNNYFAGKVMVGTTTVPTQLMYVNGTSYFNGNMTVNGTITELSTINIKTNVETLDGALDKVEKMRGVSYNRKDNHKKEIGFIAEEVDEVYPEFVEYDEQGNPVGLHYARLTAVLLQSVKELSSRIKELEKRN